MSGKIFVIDGVSNSGKTTLCTNLAKNDDYIIIEEASLFVRNHPNLFGGRQMPPIPKTVEDEISAQKFLLEIEIERLKLAFHIIRCGKNAILDRSFLSPVSIAYSFDYNNKFKGVYIHSIKLFREYLNFIHNLNIDNNLVYIFLVANHHIIQERNKTRDKVLSTEWIDENLMNLQNAFFISQKDACSACIIDTSDKTKEQVVEALQGIEERKVEDGRFTLSHKQFRWNVENGRIAKKS